LIVTANAIQLVQSGFSLGLNLHHSYAPAQPYYVLAHVSILDKPTRGAAPGRFCAAAQEQKKKGDRWSARIGSLVDPLHACMFN
jgi:hypothetical protein